MDHEAILENAPLPILILQDANIEYANRALLALLERYGYDYTADALPGTPLIRFVTPDHAAGVLEQLDWLLAHDNPVHRNLPQQFVDAEGLPHSVLVSTSRVTWKGAPALVASFVLLGLDYPSGEYPQLGPGGHPVDKRSITLQSLTAREQEVAHLVASGYATDNIAALLGVHESTVRSHIKSIFKKTKTRSRIELTRLLIGFN